MSSRLSSGSSSTTDASLLTAGTLPLARLSGITTTQLDAAAGITSAQIAALDAAKITTGTVPLARLSGITTSQLAAGAAITSGQIASVAAATITGTNTLPDGVLSTNVPLLNAANSFTAAQTITSPAAATKPLIVKGAASQSADLQQWQNSSSTTLAKIDAFGNAYFAAIAGTSLGPANNNTGAAMTFGTTSPVTITVNGAAVTAVVVKGAASQSADLQQWQDSAAHVQLGVANAGSGGSPLWALKIRAVANAESMGQAHTLGAYSGKAIQVLDDAAATVGWLPLYS